MLLRYTAYTKFQPHEALLRSMMLLYQVAGRFDRAPIGNGHFRVEMMEPAINALQFEQQYEITTES